MFAEGSNLNIFHTLEIFS